MIPLVLYSDADHEHLVQFGSLPPSEIASLVELVKSHGACIGDGGFAFASAAYDLDRQRFEIVVTPGW